MIKKSFLFLNTSFGSFLLSILIAWSTFKDITSPQSSKKFPKIFSLSTNVKELFKLSECNISCINGIIVFSYILMCYMHSMQVLINKSGLSGSYGAFKTRCLFVAAYLSIDSFLMLSGFMFAACLSQKDVPWVLF